MGFLEERAGLTGKVAAVIGGGSGIGAAVTTALAGAGIDVAFCDIKADSLPATRAAVEAAGRRAVAVTADATDAAQLGEFYAEVGRSFDRLDIVVNVVGGVFCQNFMDKTPAQCEGDIRRNYGYVIDSVRYAVPLIRRSGRGGSIINFTTIEAHRGAAGFAVYAGAKAATTNFTRAMAVELGHEGIRLNTIAPDTTPSEGNVNALSTKVQQAMARLSPEALAAQMAMYIPLKQPAGTDDLANAVLFLASDLSRFITGTTLHVDGGTAASFGFIDWPFGDGFMPCPLDGTLRKLYG